MMQTLQTLTNRLLALDPEVQDAFKGLDGKVIAIELTDLQVAAYVCPTVEGIQLLAEAPLRVDTTIRGTTLALLRNGVTQKIWGGYHTAGSAIDGDLEIARAFNDLMQRFEIDWEELMAGLVGDQAAHAVGDIGRGTINWAKSTHETIGLDIKEYLTEEARMLPCREELVEFYTDVDALRDDVARCSARLDLLRTGE